MPRRRPKTDLYLAAVDLAVGTPGQWIEVPRRFDSEHNAAMTAHCLRGGFLRVSPRDGDAAVIVAGKEYIKTAAPVTSRVEPAGAEWKLSICFES